MSLLGADTPRSTGPKLQAVFLGMAHTLVSARSSMPGWMGQDET